MFVDFHSHILPSIDDGSSSIHMSIEMLREEAKQEITTVILTPHFYPHRDRPEKFLERRSNAYKLLKEEASKQPHLPKLVLGAEVLYFNGIHHFEGLKDLAIEGTNYVLIEMPMPPWPKQMFHEIDSISSNLNLIPIIAHIDRYIKPFKTYGIPEKLEDIKCLVQANASFFEDKWTKSLALKLFKENKIHLLGSDCHNLDSRPPNMANALSRIENKLGQEAIADLFQYQDQVFNKESKGEI